MADDRIVIWAGNDPGTRHFGVMFLKHTPTARMPGLRWQYMWGATVTAHPKATMHERLLQIHAAVVHQQRTGYPAPVRYVVESQEGARIGARERGESNYHVDKIERVIGMLWEHSLMNSFAPRVPLIEVTPTFVRKSLGLAKNATKGQMHAMLRQLVPSMPKKGLKEHELDAGCIAIAGERRRQIDETTERVRAAAASRTKNQVKAMAKDATEFERLVTELERDLDGTG